MSWMPTSKPSRVIIEEVTPCEPEQGCFVKRVVGEKTLVHAAIYADGHQEISADLLWRKKGVREWERVSMKQLGNDIFRAEFTGTIVGLYEYKVYAWINEYKTWEHDLIKKQEGKQPLEVEFEIGKQLIKEAIFRAVKEDQSTLKSLLKEIEKKKNPFPLFLESKTSEMMRNYPSEQNISTSSAVTLRYQRQRALFSSWYELFPRSFGGFKGVIKELPRIAKMGFDVLYLPPIHPIGQANRKGKNNAAKALKDDPGSPWAIGSVVGGHDAIHPDLGTMQDFIALRDAAKKQGLELALDLALQCSADHPYVKKHPEWFAWRPDGTVQYAENPPKKYEDIIPIFFDTKNWEALWNEMLRVVLFWVDKGVQIFRVDNPHTKPFAFWKWLIDQVHLKDPEVIFLSEAFTRPHPMQQLAKVGFDQSYTYFTWRNTKWELMQYVKELTESPLKDFFRPNFWPNTPDILPDYLQQGGRSAFIVRFVLAATLSSNYGIYGPAFERCVSEPFPGKEEYLNSEKYELKVWEPTENNLICDVISLVNTIRKEHRAFQTTWNLQFCDINNDMLISYIKSDNFLVVVNLDPYNIQAGTVKIPLQDLSLSVDQPYLVHDLLSNKKYIWQGREQYIELNPQQMPAHIFQVHAKVHREQDFDYFM